MGHGHGHSNLALNLTVGLALGALAGLAIGLLLAPKTGSQARILVKEAIGKGMGKLRELETGQELKVE
jgi:gas vesicle protein